MRTSIPRDVASLLHTKDQASRDRAWATFLETYTPLILRTARLMGGNDDAVMDRYEFVIAQLCRDDCQRLRKYVADGRGEFTTWLVLVVRRLCLDEHRRRYGRPQSRDATARDEHRARQQLVDLVGQELAFEELQSDERDDPDAQLRVSELRAALRRALTSLEVSERLVLRLRFEDELSVPEIARLVRAPSAAHVYRQIDKVLGRVQQLLREAGVEDSIP